jgi:hypothetical protein
LGTYVDEFDDVYLLKPAKIKDNLYLHIQINIDSIPQADKHVLDGTHRSDEPVSKSIRKAWPGVPIVISPMKYSYLNVTLI